MASVENVTTPVALRSNNSKTPLFPENLVTAVCMYEIFVIIFSISGYALVAFAMLLNPRLRSICNYFILSMGLADGLIATVIIPVNLGLMLKTLRYHSVAACEFVSNINLISVVAVALNLCAVSLERFFVIGFPFGYEVFLTHKTVAATILGLWGYALVVGLLPQMGWSGGDTIVVRGFCRRPLSTNYVLFLTVAHFCIPAVIMLVSNALVYRIATKQAKRIFKITIRANQTAENESEESISQVFRMNYRAAKRVSIIVGTYLFCWLPQMMVLLVGLNIGYTKIPALVFPITLALQYTSSAVNPCIFCLMNRELRTTLKREFQLRFPLYKRFMRPPNERMVGSELTPPRDESFRGIDIPARSSQSTTIASELLS